MGLVDFLTRLAEKRNTGVIDMLHDYALLAVIFALTILILVFFLAVVVLVWAEFYFRG